MHFSSLYTNIETLLRCVTSGQKLHMLALVDTVGLVTHWDNSFNIDLQKN